MKPLNTPLLRLLAATLALAAAAPALATELPHRGAFTCDFEVQLDPAAPPDRAAGLIEHDRQLMAGSDAAAGMRHKVVPIQLAAPGTARTGGRYLFDRWAQARSYERFVTREFRTFDPATGAVVPFLQRSGTSAADCRSWRVIGAAEFAGVREAHHHVRTERWVAPSAHGLIGRLRHLWPQVKSAARQQPGVSAVWLLADREDRTVSLVVFQQRTGRVPGTGLDTLMGAPSLLQDEAGRQGWTPTFLAGHLALSIWWPFEPGDRGEPSLWPNADALPIVPSLRDGVCAPSRGENATNDPACPAACGNARADAGETWLNCPADVSPYRD